jgi:hypothetical protein
MKTVKIVDRHHENYNDNHMARLQKYPHMVGVKTNGNPYLMYLTRINFVNTVILIDKKILMGYTLPRMIIVWLNFKDDSLFDNTLFEGEMIHDNNDKWLLLLSDIRILRNASTKRMNLIDRVNTIYRILDNSFVASFQDLFSVQVKKYVNLNNLDEFHDTYMPSLPYTCRGLYFKPVYPHSKDILLNFDTSLIKTAKVEKYKNNSHFLMSTDELKKTKPGSKPPKPIQVKCTVPTPQQDADVLPPNSEKIFLIQKTDTPDIYILFDYQTKKECGIACVDSLRTSKMLYTQFSTLSMLVKLAFRCELTKNDNFVNKWIPIEQTK